MDKVPHITILPRMVVFLLIFALFGCSGSDRGVSSSDLFSISSANSTFSIVEGENAGINIPITLTRAPNYNGDVEFRLTGNSSSDTTDVTAVFSNSTLDSNATSTTLNLRLDIAALPILAQQRTFVIRAADAADSSQQSNQRITVNVTPVDAMDVYLLIGQSNMVGFSGDGTKMAGPGEPDEPNDRILQLNVTKNSETEVFTDASSYTDINTIALSPRLVVAEDPLHVPQNSDSRAKEENYIGLGLSFAKRALQDTSRNIVLVPAAWSGSAFCINSLPAAYWNPSETPDNSNLGNTLLFDRAVARTNLALSESGGILRGILWHQGESDAFAENPACADLYQQNLQLLVSELRSRIIADRRGPAARQPDANIPFVVGTMSVGNDSNGDFSILSAEKQIIDNVHRSVESLVSHSALSNHDDLVPPAYPCGNSSCIHFGAEAFRVMGGRYYDALRRAATR
ncbi:MAG: sialate O-acetylesterase [Granulosicoccus sp.]|nr:sialate O-acetylesterase [Granulosicoccus sp.]